MILQMMRLSLVDVWSTSDDGIGLMTVPEQIGFDTVHPTHTRDHLRQCHLGGS